MAKKEKVVFLSGKKINLRPFDKTKDLEKTRVWINDQEVLQYLSSYLPQTRRDEELWFDKERKNEVVLAVETRNGVSIGSVGLHNIDYRSGTAELGIMIGEKDYWSKGYGFDMEMTLLNYGFNELNLRKICHDAFILNRKSVGLAKKCGGIKEGILRKHIFKGGKYQDRVLFAIFKKRWQKIWQKYLEEK